uniref:Uncharacterized protein n=1 Tax=Parascaris univalens TaxID=6257 RepID=A0A915A9C3_PARUN
MVRVGHQMSGNSSQTQRYTTSSSEPITSNRHKHTNKHTNKHINTHGNTNISTGHHSHMHAQTQAYALMHTEA